MKVLLGMSLMIFPVMCFLYVLIGFNPAILVMLGVFCFFIGLGLLENSFVERRKK